MLHLEFYIWITTILLVAAKAHNISIVYEAKTYIIFVGIKAQIIYWALGLVREYMVIQGWIKSSGWFKFSVPWVGYKWEDRPRRNISLDKPSISQMCIIIFKVTFQEVLVIGTIIMSIQEGGSSEISQGKLLPSH